MAKPRQGCGRPQATKLSRAFFLARSMVFCVGDGGDLWIYEKVYISSGQEPGCLYLSSSLKGKTKFQFMQKMHVCLLYSVQGTPIILYLYI